MRENTGIEPGRLLHLRVERAVRVDTMHADHARIVVSSECVGAGGVNARVNGARGQHLCLAVQVQCAVRLHAQCAQAVNLCGNGCIARCAVARGGINKLPRRMRPHILNVGRHGHRRARCQRGAIDIEFEVAQPGADALVQRTAAAARRARCCRASEQGSRGGARECAIESAAIHGGRSRIEYRLR